MNYGLQLMDYGCNEAALFMDYGCNEAAYLWSYGCNNVAIKDYGVKSKIKASFMDSFLLFLQL